MQCSVHAGFMVAAPWRAEKDKADRVCCRDAESGE